MERQTNQEKWNALAVKVPEFAPWAHFGFTRLKRTLEHAQNVYFNKDKNYSQGEVNAIVASLNTVINTMRPGNLPEMEDLTTFICSIKARRHHRKPYLSCN